MSVVDGFLTTWSNARQTFGEGSPQTGEQYDKSATFTQLQSTVQTAAPGSKWSGGAANAYDATNTQHGQVLGKLAGLDQRLAAHVTQSAEVVAAGRQNLDSIRKWVVDAAASVPEGKTGDQMRMAIVQKGLTQLQEVVRQTNSQSNAIAGQMGGLRGEFEALGNDIKFKDGVGGALGVKGDDEEKKKKEEEEKRKRDIDEANNAGKRDGDSLGDGKLSPEETKRLHDATALTPEQKSALDNGNLTLPAERMSYLNGLSHSLDGKSPAEIKAILDRLPPDDARAVSNGLHLVGTEGVHTDGTDPSVKPGEHGYVPANGGKENLPKSIQDVFDAPLQNNPSGDWITNPDGSKTFVPPDYNKPYKFLDEYRDIAAISNYGDPAFQRGSAINDGLLSESRELLDHFQSDRWPNYDNDWGHKNLDPALQDMLSAASHDPIAVHDAVAGSDGKSPNNDFIEDLYKHDWADDGKSAGALFPDTTDHSARAGETMHAFDEYAGVKYQDLLNMAGNDSIGQVNPELVRALGQANVPYIDDMAGHDIDGTKGFGHIDTGANANNMRGLFAVIDSDAQAGDAFNAHATDVWKQYLADYSFGLKEGDIPDGELLQSVGRLQGAMDMGEYINQLDQGNDSYTAAKNAYDKHAQWYDAAHAIASYTPKLQEVVGVFDSMPDDPLRKLFVGEEPTANMPTPMPLRDMDEISRTVASYLVHEKAGDLGTLQDFIQNGELQADSPGAQKYIDQYLSDLARHNEFPWVKWTGAYEASIYYSPGEFDKISPPRK